jgi:hypothetical protein
LIKLVKGYQATMPATRSAWGETVEQRPTAAHREADETDLAGERVRHLLGALDSGPEETRAVGSCKGVGVEEDGVVAELGDLLGHEGDVRCAEVPGEHDHDAPLALGRGEFLLGVGVGGGEDCQADEHGGYTEDFQVLSPSGSSIKISARMRRSGGGRSSRLPARLDIN